jgi:hypothetical protein
MPYGSDSVTAQLKARAAFPTSAWCNQKLPMEFVIKLLRLMKLWMGLPTYFLLPDDSFSLLFLAGSPHFLIEDVIYRIEREFGVKVSLDDFTQMYRDGNSTVVRFVNYVFQHAEP